MPWNPPLASPKKKKKMGGLFYIGFFGILAANPVLYTYFTVDEGPIWLLINQLPDVEA